MAAITQLEKKNKLPRKLNVAAYARVSCDKESMLKSLCTQVAYFSNIIQKNTEWNYVGVYSDYAVSGTKASRGDFDKLYEDAKAGKIDMVLVKGLSRFARNIEVTLTWIRTLKAIDVDIYFEIERIHTLSSDGELLITLLASSAQEQSRTASLNVLWKIKRSFEEGIPFGGGDCYGYKMVEKKFILVPEQAEIVKRIYQLYLGGNGYSKIAKTLNDDGIKSFTGGLWSKNSIRTILINQNYTGDLILQKTYRQNYISKKTLINRGEKDMYLVENNHEAIISRETFEKAKSIRASKNGRCLSPKPAHPFTGLIVCGICGKAYKFQKTPYCNKYLCTTYNELGKKYCSSKAVPEETLKDEIAKLLGQSEFNEKKMRERISKLIVFNDNKIEVHFIDGRNETIQWKDRSRSLSWTPEMKEAARQRQIAGGKNNGNSNPNTTED